MTVRSRIAAAVESIVELLTGSDDGPDNDPPEIDKRYIWESDQFARYWYVDVMNRDDEDAVRRDGWYGLRCNLCGRIFKLDAVEELFSHVGSHTDDGELRVNPFRTRENVADASLLNTAEDGTVPLDVPRVVRATGAVSGLNQNRREPVETDQNEYGESLADVTADYSSVNGEVIGPRITEEQRRKAREQSQDDRSEDGVE